MPESADVGYASLSQASIGPPAFPTTNATGPIQFAGIDGAQTPSPHSLRGPPEDEEESEPAVNVSSVSPVDVLVDVSVSGPVEREVPDSDVAIETEVPVPKVCVVVVSLPLVDVSVSSSGSRLGAKQEGSRAKARRIEADFLSIWIDE